MPNFYIRGILANLVTLAVLLACLFIPAGTLNYWQAWVFVAVFAGSAQALGIYFLIHDRKLVERRMNIGPVVEQRPAQKLISALFMLGFVVSQRRRSRANLRPPSRSASVIDRLLKNQNPLENCNNLRLSSPCRQRQRQLRRAQVFRATARQLNAPSARGWRRLASSFRRMNAAR